MIKKLVLMVFKLNQVLMENYLGIHMPTLPPLCNLVNDLKKIRILRIKRFGISFVYPSFFLEQLGKTSFRELSKILIVIHYYSGFYDSHTKTWDYPLLNSFLWSTGQLFSTSIYKLYQGLFQYVHSYAECAMIE